jgi:hypothetical protein
MKRGRKTGERSQKSEIRRSVGPGSGKEDRIYWIFGMVVGEGGGPLVLDAAQTGARTRARIRMLRHGVNGYGYGYVGGGGRGLRGRLRLR